MNRIQSLHTFTMQEGFAHEDEGTAEAAPSNVKGAMEKVKLVFDGAITDHKLAAATQKILSPFNFTEDNTLLATSLCCDEVNRDLEDEFRAIYGQNYSFGGIAGFPFGGVTAFGSLLHHTPHYPEQGNVVIVYGPHVGVDYDGVVGKVNRKGHKGSGSCCNTAIASMAYVKAVRSGHEVHSPDPSDPVDAQQVFVDSALLAHGERLEQAEDPNVELPHALFDCMDELMCRIIAKCTKDIPTGARIALLGGVQVNAPEGLPNYFLPKKFHLLDNKGQLLEDLLDKMVTEGKKDPRIRLNKKMAEKMLQDTSPYAPAQTGAPDMINITVDPSKK